MVLEAGSLRPGGSMVGSGKGLSLGLQMVEMEWGGEGRASSLVSLNKDSDLITRGPPS